MMLCLFQHTEGVREVLKQVSFQIRNRPSALPKGASHGAMSGMRGRMSGELEEPSGQTVTNSFDRCHDAVTTDTKGRRLRQLPTHCELVAFDNAALTAA
jgi:hypothetical protein